MTLICDMEGDNLLYGIKNVWCIVAYDIERDEYLISLPEQWGNNVQLFEQLYPIEDKHSFTSHETLLNCIEKNKIVFHNAFGFDIPALQKLYPPFNPPRVEDTFILSSLFNPDRPGGHSVESYGESFGITKPKHEDWTQFSPEMLHRCIEDVKITVKIWKLMEKERHSHDWEAAIQGEYNIAKANAQQEMNGVLFDSEYAMQLYSEIDAEIQTINQEVIPQIPKICTPMEGKDGYRIKGMSTTYKKKADITSQGIGEQYIEPVYGCVRKPFKKDGTLTKRIENFINEDN